MFDLVEGYAHKNSLNVPQCNKPILKVLLV